MAKKPSLTLTIETPKDAAKRVVGMFSVGEFMNKHFANRWLTRQLEQEFSKRDTSLLQDLGSQGKLGMTE